MKQASASILKCHESVTTPYYSGSVADCGFPVGPHHPPGAPAMQRETDLPLPVRCETCGVEYQATQERCPRCNSNQRKVMTQMKSAVASKKESADK